MDSIFNIGEEIPSEKIDIDSLYAEKKSRDLNTLTTYKRVLARVHTRIKTVSRVRDNSECCWYLVPEVIIGLPKFDTSSCIAYLVFQLKENGFLVRYTHPNLLFIAWNHWTPDYVRAEFRKRTGIAIDGLGNRRPTAAPSSIPSKGTLRIPAKKDGAKAISSYAPTGKLVYSDSQLQKITLPS